MGDYMDAYAAGFFDGEGWICIGLEPGSETRSDCHRIGVYITQRARYRAALDKIQERFGGLVTVRDQKVKGSENWAEQADWHTHKRPEIERFCRAVQPYCIVKAQQIAIALEFVTGFSVGSLERDVYGHIRGRGLTLDEVARRERLRVALHEANAKGPTHAVQIVRERRQPHRADNSQRVVPVNTTTVSRGESRYNAVLTEAAVREIRAAHAAGRITLEATAAQYGVSPAAIRQVIRRISWKHVTDLPDSAPPEPPVPSLAADQLGLFGPDV